MIRRLFADTALLIAAALNAAAAFLISSAFSIDPTLVDDAG